MRAAVIEDPGERCAMDLRAGADRVGAQGVQLLERVGRIAREHHVASLVVDADHRDVPGRVARCGDRHDAAVGAQSEAALERPEGRAVELEGGGGEAGGKGWRRTLRMNWEKGALA